MDLEFVAVLVVLAVALLPIALAFPSRLLRASLVVCWAGLSLAIPRGIDAYRAARVTPVPNNRPIERPREDYLGSKACGACHPHEYDTWKHTWHRTMTQLATPDAVFGDFDGVELDTQGWKTTLERRGDEFFARIYEESLSKYVWRKIVMTTGSHHMQAYWYTRGPGKTLGQLQFTYLKEEKRWVPRASVFIMPPSLVATNETGRWNTVCMGCHTTRGRPGMEHEFSEEANSDAVEFGIACEACHGPGSEHAQENRGNPAKRYAKHFLGEGDDSIVNAETLVKERSAEVCGQCHGIGMRPDDVQAFFRTGYDYRAGDVLDETGRSVMRGGDQYPYPSSERSKAYHDTLFWADGMARVSGREVNGLYETECFERGEMTCLSCHTLHKEKDDPRSWEVWADDMLSPGMRTDHACLQCHEAFAEDIQAHTNHAAGSSGSACLNCHMPYTTWGLLKGIRQHTVDAPRVGASVETGRPNACNACHVDQTLAWSAGWTNAWYGEPIPKLSEDEKTVAASLLWLIKGDAGQRALAAWLLGWEPAQQVAGTDWIAPQLAPLLEDSYDVVRYVAARSLRSLPGYADLEYDFVGAEAERAPAKRDVWERYGASSTARAREGQKPDPQLARRVLLYEDGSLDRVALGRLLAQRDDREVTLSE